MIKNNKLFKMLKDLQNDNELGGFNEFSQFCEEYLFEAIKKGYLTSQGKKALKWQMESCFMSDGNKQKYLIN
jgi:hypothetical protein